MAGPGADTKTLETEGARGGAVMGVDLEDGHDVVQSTTAGSSGLSHSGNQSCDDGEGGASLVAAKRMRHKMVWWSHGEVTTKCAARSRD